MFDCLCPDLFRLTNHPIQSDGLPFWSHLVHVLEYHKSHIYFLMNELNLLLDNFLATKIKLWSERPVNILKVFKILSARLLKIKSIWDLVELVILVGPLIICFRSKWSVIGLRFFLMVLSSQLILKYPIIITSLLKSHCFSNCFKFS